VEGGFVFVANAHSGNISGYSVDSSGALDLLGTGGLWASVGPGNIDLAITQENAFLYNVDSGNNTMSIFAINADGSLTTLPQLSGTPLHGVGLVAR
jgi:6-phosphogluconolactonase (cycloisomerase 2 family)